MILAVLFACSGLVMLSSANPAPGPIDQLIVGGTKAKKGEFPWLVLIKANDRQYCAGTIINENWILTAAHCSSLSAGAYTVTAGEYIQSADDGTEQTVEVSDVIAHEEFDDVSYKNDIALFKLASPLTFSSCVQPGKIATQGTQAAKKLLACGWGRTRSGGQASDTLLKVTVPLQPDSKCERAYRNKPYPFLRESEICAGEGGKDTCQGDSGGPLHQGVSSSDKTVVGVVSYGEGCADPNYPGVYTKIAYYQDWISSHMD
ncbi:trypsin-1 [Folsomia candida]|uniref:trypsin-1 n=1 Tax=Folsomia candida TaxID=158441 RepID=UPI000B8FE706|nr:trypsin-1 [Folsomia candida]